MTIKPYEKISRLFFYQEILFKMKYLKNKTYIEKSPTQIFPRSVISAWVGACQKKKEKTFQAWKIEVLKRQFLLNKNYLSKYLTFFYLLTYWFLLLALKTSIKRTER